jgi:two-component system sensor histidine kinase CpxA
MNSLFAKILLWFWCTLAISVVGSALISALDVNESNRDRRALIGRLVANELERARAAYESGGRPALAACLENLHSTYDASGILTDQNGRDLLTGQDRAALVRLARAAPRPQLGFRFFALRNGMAARAADDGHYWFFMLVPRARMGSWFLMPEHLFMLAVAALMCYWLAFHLTSPVRALQKAVERFGRGDLSARAGSRRRDELGQLARTFDRMAGRMEKLVGAERRLLLDISHELRSPLARLGVAVELARSGEENERQAALDRIQKESDRLNALVGQLLEVTRAEGDPQALRREGLRLDGLVRQLVDESGIEAAAHGNQVVFGQQEPVTVEGDPELLRRAIENAIRNAIRYAPEGSAVEVSLARQNGKATVRVRDHGPGVPEEALPRLFDAFYRVDTARDRSSGGVGLGLSIARRAVELHQGAIRARNAQPGLEVEIELPARA